MKIWLVDSICMCRDSVCNTDGAWSYHLTKEGAKKKMTELQDGHDNYLFEVKEVEVEQ